MTYLHLRLFVCVNNRSMKKKFFDNNNPSKIIQPFSSGKKTKYKS